MSEKFFKELEVARLSSYPWKSSKLRWFKIYIKKRVIEKQDNYCCYCRKDLSKESERNKHIEHILPKSKFPYHMLDFENLAISCARCNSDVKKASVEFLKIDLSQYENKWSNKVYKSNLYKFVHPNLDDINKHLNRKTFIIGDRVYCSYKSLTRKGEYHYKYFDLKFYELKKLNENQGFHPIEPTKGSKQLINDLFMRHN